MAAVLFDTDVLIDFLRGHDKARALLYKLVDDCAISAVSVAELHAGVREGPERNALRELLKLLEVVPLDADIAAQGGLLRRDWGKSHGVGLSDALIAATVQSTQRTLFTLNVKHYPMLRKPELKQAYTKP